MTDSLLVLCAANVCRSPLMEYVLTEPGSGAVAEKQWSTTSRGTEATRSRHLCPTVTDLVSGTDYGRSFAEEHRPRLVDPDTLDGFDLIVTASRAERAIVARLHPELRSRTFTAKEAVRLGRSPLTEVDLHRAAAVAPGKAGLSLYAATLNERRGMVSFGEARGSLVPWRKPADPLDIPDVHDGTRRVHLRTLKDAEQVAHELRTQLVRFLRGPGVALRRH